MRSLVSLVGIASFLGISVHAGTVVWSGSFDAYSSASDFDNWSWSNQVGEYQWYIHGSGATSDYLALDPSYKNPADTDETQGLRVTIDSSAIWNSDGMERTELIPQTSANLGTGNLIYHFSIMQDGENSPNFSGEHQILFFESHFTELKTGVSPNSTYLQWFANSQAQWGTEWEAGTWYNFAYDIDFDAQTVALYSSTGSDDLQLTVPAVSAATSSNSADFHVGVLSLLVSDVTENYYLSGVYVEEAPITTSISGSGAASSSSSESSSDSGDDSGFLC
ncbi:hypothetical protein A7U60_g3884 [Sanghuangporus baumii]|uniref:Glycoside hydrolase 131 catalytic N-terminal domain-containing protein n=1 Tax=Sanghuangporus baumii TaxID=108892 RepID=A0A9Q5HZM0_SANBA|nr:hypothetical protein A7U60_g3884 [Sanghuangporus baumii]